MNRRHVIVWINNGSGYCDFACRLLYCWFLTWPLRFWLWKELGSRTTGRWLHSVHRQPRAKDVLTGCGIPRYATQFRLWERCLPFVSKCTICGRCGHWKHVV